MKKLMIALSAMLFVTSCNNVTELPQVTTTNPIVSDTAVIVGGDVTFTGGDNKTTRGVCWSTSPNPTTSDNFMLDASNGAGVYSFDILGQLAHRTKYYFKAYAENELGKVYGNELTLETLFKNPKNAFVNANGCVQCDNYAVGDTFLLNGKVMVRANLAMLKDAINNGEDMTKFCTSWITEMTRLFITEDEFNQDISSWDMKNVTKTDMMFWGASSFNQDIGNWDVSNVGTMQYMFQSASSFNQDIGSWDVSNVTTFLGIPNLRGMFQNATNFNQNLTQWCVSQFSTMPSSFSTNSALTASNHPVWGTCP